MNKFSLLILLLLGTAACLTAAPKGGGSSDLDDLQGLVITNPKIPLYSKNRLQLVFFADRAERSGKNIKGTQAVLDIIRRGADPDSIIDSWGMKPYPLNTRLPQLVSFWKERVKFSEGLIFGDSCLIDTNGRSGSGTSPVFFRSPALDLDGIGFKADFERQVVIVNSDVRVVLRHGSSDLRKVLAAPGKVPAKYEFIEATGDSLRIDMKENEIMLIGNVEVLEERGKMTCDRLTIYLNGGKKKKNTPDDMDSMGSVSRVLATGDVKVERKTSGSSRKPDRAEAEQLLVDVATDTIELSGDNANPRIIASDGQIISGRTIKFFRRDMRAVISEECSATAMNSDGRPVTMTSDAGFFDINKNTNDLIGNVRINDGRSTLTCKRMRIITRENGGKKKKTADPAAGSGSLLGTEQFAAVGGDRVLDRIFFYDDVTVIDNQATMTCEEMHASFTGSAKGSNSFDLDIIDCFRKVKVLSKSKSADSKPAELTSATARLNYRSNLLIFKKNVKMKSGTSTLDCDQLDLILSDRKNKQKDRPGEVKGGLASGMTGGGKGLEKAIARGNVRMHDPMADLSGDKLTLHFTDALPGTPPPDTIQAGGLRVRTAECEGNVVAVTRAKPKTGAKKGKVDAASNPVGFFSSHAASADAVRQLKARYAKIDFDSNISEFRDNVEVSEGESLLSCNRMFLYGEKVQPVKAGSRPPAVSSMPVEEDPDLDPYATLPAMAMVPSRIMLGNGLALQRVFCEDDVLLKRKDPASGKLQQAGGGEAEYIVSRQSAEIRRRAPGWAWLKMEGIRQECEKIICDFNSGIFRTINVYKTVKE